MSDPNQSAPMSPSGGRRRTIAIVVGVVGVVAVIVVLALVLTRGGGPGDVAEDYVEASFTGDHATLCDLWVEDRRDEALSSYDVDDCDEYVAQMTKSDDDWHREFKESYDEDYESYESDLELDVEEAEVDERDAEAEVDFTVTIRYGGDNDKIIDELFQGEKSATHDRTVTLEKEDGQWKVVSD